MKIMKKNINLFSTHVRKSFWIPLCPALRLSSVGPKSWFDLLHLQPLEFECEAGVLRSGCARLVARGPPG